MFHSNRFALNAIHEETNGATWIHSGGWQTDEELGRWFGVTAVGTLVASIVLTANGLRGKLSEIVARSKRPELL